MITTISELKQQDDSFFGVSGDAPTSSGDLIPALKIANLPSELCADFGVGTLIYEPYRKHLNKIEVGNTNKDIEIIPLTVEFYFQTPYSDGNKPKTYQTIEEAHNDGYVISFERKSHPDKPYVDRCAKILALVNMTEFVGQNEIVEPISDGDSKFGVAYIYANKRNFDVAKTIYGYVQMKKVRPCDLSFRLKSEKIMMNTKSGEKPYYVLTISDYYDTTYDLTILLHSLSGSSTNTQSEDNVPF